MKSKILLGVLYSCLPATIQWLLYKSLYGISGGDIIVDFIAFLLIIIELSLALIIFRKTQYFFTAMVATFIAMVICCIVFSLWNQHLKNIFEKSIITHTNFNQYFFEMPL